MKTVNKNEQAPIRQVIAAGAFDGMAENDQKNQKEFRVVPAGVALRGGQRIRSFLAYCG